MSALIFQCFWKTLTFNFRDGDNFVYFFADWKNDPLTATITFGAFVAISTVFHFAVNAVHKTREKLHNYMFANRVNAEQENRRNNESYQVRFAPD